MSARAAAGIVAGVMLLAAGFAAGYLTHVRVARRDRQLREEQFCRNNRENLVREFLDRPAPAVAAPTVDGEEWRLEDRQGKVVLVFFWATFCRFSRAAIGDMKAIYDAYGGREDFEMVGVSVDSNRDNLLGYTAQAEIPWVNVFEDAMGWDNRFARAFDVNGVPSVWIIDQDGVVRGVRVKRDAIEPMLRRLLGSPVAASP